MSWTAALSGSRAAACTSVFTEEGQSLVAAHAVAASTSAATCFRIAAEADAAQSSSSEKNDGGVGAGRFFSSASWPAIPALLQPIALEFSLSLSAGEDFRRSKLKQTQAKLKLNLEARAESFSKMSGGEIDISKMSAEQLDMLRKQTENVSLPM